MLQLRPSSYRDNTDLLIYCEFSEMAQNKRSSSPKYIFARVVKFFTTHIVMLFLMVDSTVSIKLSALE